MTENNQEWMISSMSRKEKMLTDSDEFFEDDVYCFRNKLKLDSFIEKPRIHGSSEYKNAFKKMSTPKK